VRDDNLKKCEPPVHIDILEDSFDALADYATIPIAFDVRSVLDPSTMKERALERPYVKDYDAVERPTDWPTRFDVSGWTLLVARIDGRRVGGAAIAIDTPGLDMPGGRRDVAVLWDLRVAPEVRGHGVGTALFRAAERWAEVRCCTALEVETQDINVPACRLYARMGCELGAVRPNAYAEFPDEIQLVWHKRLDAG
jgi:GNAT superfamily N-acetyltransferase